MEKYLKPSVERVTPRPRRNWKRNLVELNGRFEPNYRHEMLDLLVRSYSEVGVFPHLYQGSASSPCQSHINRVVNEANGDQRKKQGISAVDFDSKGIYLASVTKSGCFTVHDFEALYCQIPELTCLKEDENKHLMHLTLHRQLDAVRWNPLNQDEVVCSSVQRNELLIFDVGYLSSKPVEVLRTRLTITVQGSSMHKGLSDIAFTSNDTRILACDTIGTIHVWDRRVDTLPCLELASGSHCGLNSIQLNADNQIIFGAGRHGLLHVWDTRGGSGSATFQSHKEIRHPPVTSVKLATLLAKIRSLKAQTDIVPKEIHSLAINPSCPYQLAFHLDDGWSGVLDINNFQVTHIHCPPPAWLNHSYIPADQSYIRRPSWLSTCSIYMAGSSSDSGIYLLDFYPSTNSPSHVEYKEENMQEISKQNNRSNQNRFISLSEGVISCAAHPLYNAIVAGTKKSSLVVISQRQESCKSED